MNNWIMKADARLLKEFVTSELKELETRDVDQLLGCLSENLDDMGIEYSLNDLYAEIEDQVLGKAGTK